MSLFILMLHCHFDQGTVLIQVSGSADALEKHPVSALSQNNQSAYPWSNALLLAQPFHIFQCYDFSFFFYFAAKVLKIDAFRSELLFNSKQCYEQLGRGLFVTMNQKQKTKNTSASSLVWRA